MKIRFHRIWTARPYHVQEKRLGLDGNLLDRRDRKALGCFYGTLRLWWFKIDVTGGVR